MIAQTPAPKVYAVIVTHNGEKWIEKCLQSLLASEYPVDVIVVDNVSTDRTPQLVKNQSNVTLIQQQFNIGFGQANNIGIQLALRKGAEKIFLLNQDAWISPDTLSKLVCCMEDDNSLGIVSPIHLSGDGAKVDTKFAGYIKEISVDLFYDLSFGQLRSVYYTGFVNAAAWMLSRNCLEKIGGFDPIFFMYGEDLDLYNRAKFHGFQVGVVPNSFICHDRIQDSAGQSSHVPFKKATNFRAMNMLCDLKKPSSSFVTNWISWAYYSTKEGVRFLAKFQFDEFIILASAVTATIRQQSKIIKHRKTCLSAGMHWIN